MKLIVGLGNPGTEYQRTRHNIGWQALDMLATALDAGSFQDKKEFRSLISETRFENEKIFLVKPLTYMNASGEAVRAIQQYYKLVPSDLLILQDEMDFAPGSFALLAKGGAAGHNGISSLQQHLGTTELQRVRIGIGRPVPPLKKEDYVLGRFTNEEEERIQSVLKTLQDVVKDWIRHGVDKTMNTWNGV